jgi:aspartate dehydrogenase
LSNSVAIAGLGAIGFTVARAIDSGAIPGLHLAAIAVRDQAKAREKLAAFKRMPHLTGLAALADHADIVVECVPAAAFAEVAMAAVEKGRILVLASVGQLIDHMHLIERAKATGARIVVPTGALLGLDAVRAAAEGEIQSVEIVTRKPPASLRGAPLLAEKGIDVDALTGPLCIFTGSAREAIRGFPANVNVAVALSLAGIGPDRTRVAIWADPGVERNTHTITVVSDSSDFTMSIAGRPSPENPATGRLTPLSVIATLRRLTAPFVVGS